MDILQKLQNSVVGVKAGQPCTCDLAIGPRYKVIWFKATISKTGAAPVIGDVMDLIRLKVGGKTVREITATNLDARNTLLGAEYAATFMTKDTATVVATPLAAGIYDIWLPMCFAEPWRKEYGSQDLNALPTSFTNGSRTVQLNSLQLEVLIPNIANTSLHNLQVYAETDGGVGSLQSDNATPKLAMSMFKQKNVPYTAAGDLAMDKLDKGPLYQAMSIIQTTDTISQFRLERDGIVREVPKAMNDVALVKRGFNAAFIAANPSRLDIQFDYDDKPNNLLATAGATDFKLIPRIVSSTGGNFQFLTETYESVF